MFVEALVPALKLSAMRLGGGIRDGGTTSHYLIQLFIQLILTHPNTLHIKTHTWNPFQPEPLAGPDRKPANPRVRIASLSADRSAIRQYSPSARDLLPSILPPQPFPRLLPVADPRCPSSQRTLKVARAPSSPIRRRRRRWNRNGAADPLPRPRSRPRWNRHRCEPSTSPDALPLTRPVLSDSTVRSAAGRLRRAAGALAQLRRPAPSPSPSLRPAPTPALSPSSPTPPLREPRPPPTAAPTVIAAAVEPDIATETSQRRPRRFDGGASISRSGERRLVRHL